MSIIVIGLFPCINSFSYAVPSEELEDHSNKQSYAYSENALFDVTYLVPVFEKMAEALKDSGRDKWVDEEMKRLVDIHLYKVDPYESWKKIKRHSDNPRFLALLRELAAWREKKAIELDKPRRHFLKDEGLLEIAATAPQSLEELSQLRSITSGLLKNFGEEILKAVSKGKKLPDKKCPIVERPKCIPEGRRNLVEILKFLLNLLSDKEKVAAKIIATTEDLEKIAESDKADVPALKGWRYHLFGKYAIAFKQGKIALRLNPKT